MLDIHLLRENPEAVRANLARRRAPERLDRRGLKLCGFATSDVA